MSDDQRRRVVAHAHTLIEAARERCATARRARQAARVAIARSGDLVERCREGSIRRLHDRTPTLTGRDV